MSYKVRVTRPVISYLEGSDAWARNPQSHPDDVRLCDTIKAAKWRKDGSCPDAADRQTAAGLMELLS